MYFRRKTSPSGQVLQLLESYRNVEGQPRQRVVVSLGNAAVPEKHWEEIATVVEKRLYGQPELFPGEHPAVVNEWADIIVRRVDLGGRWQARSHSMVCGWMGWAIPTRRRWGRSWWDGRCGTSWGCRGCWSSWGSMRRSGKRRPPVC
jgi:hypothetical protein